MENELRIGELNFNLSCSSNGQFYPFGLFMFGRNHKQCKDELTDITIIIDNDSEEGIKLHQMLKDKIEIELLKEYMFSLIVKYKSLSEIMECINVKMKKNFDRGFYEGRRNKLEEIKKVLAI